MPTVDGCVGGTPICDPNGALGGYSATMRNVHVKDWSRNAKQVKCMKSPWTYMHARTTGEAAEACNASDGCVAFTCHVPNGACYMIGKGTERKLGLKYTHNWQTWVKNGVDTNGP
eukprot:NODE_1254_length_573_cov_186.181298_g1179_i0.p1 GENE.NODE_1254_length_573_cov_186.181298_g1179_i0~~NODE_1254_length_573_cov_186.181298_g1179_i0.p1  ORF type:complete len:115 (-),score=17.25 NODE_1254_length_573_cov_186.181298_g1179_i0:194-538(-)